MDSESVEWVTGALGAGVLHELAVTVGGEVGAANKTCTGSPPLDPATDLTQHCPRFTFVLNTVVIGLLCVLGLTGNTVSILVLQKDRHNRVAVFLLQALALADNTVLLLSLLVLSIVYGLLPVLGLGAYCRQHINPYMVHYVNPLGYVAQSCVIWITVLLAVNRYVAVCRPFTARRWLSMTSARLQVGVVVLLSTLLNIPRWFSPSTRRDCVPWTASNLTLTTLGLVSSPPTRLAASTLAPTLLNASARHNDSLAALSELFLPPGQPGDAAPGAVTALGGDSVCNCTDVTERNYLYEVVYLNAIYTSVVLILPLVLMVGLNVPLVRQIQASKRRMMENSLSYRGLQENNITVVMVIVVLVMIVCHAPDRVVSVVRFLSAKDEIVCPRSLFYAINLANLLVMTNSSTDFLVYYIFRRRFRTILCSKLRCLSAGGEGERVSATGEGGTDPQERRRAMSAPLVGGGHASPPGFVRGSDPRPWRTERNGAHKRGEGQNGVTDL